VGLLRLRVSSTLPCGGQTAAARLWFFVTSAHIVHSGGAAKDAVRVTATGIIAWARATKTTARRRHHALGGEYDARAAWYVR